MFNLKSLAVAGALVLGAIATTTGTASAGSTKLGIHVHAPGVHAHIGHRSGRYHRPRYSRNYYAPRYNRWRRPARVRVCTPGKAVYKARANGVRKAHIYRIGSRNIVIAGKKRGKRILMGIGKSRYCPVRFVAKR